MRQALRIRICGDHRGLRDLYNQTQPGNVSTSSVLTGVYRLKAFGKSWTNDAKHQVCTLKVTAQDVVVLEPQYTERGTLGSIAERQINSLVCLFALCKRPLINETTRPWNMGRSPTYTALGILVYVDSKYSTPKLRWYQSLLMVTPDNHRSI